MIYLYNSIVPLIPSIIEVHKKMKVAILGSGCTKCKTLEEIVRELVKELELDVDIVKITEINEIIEYGVMLTPGLVIDGEVIVSGRLPSRSEIETYLKSASS